MEICGLIIMKLKFSFVIMCLVCACGMHGQNLVVNPSFEDQGLCELINPDMFCSTSWGPSTLDNDPVNTPDICYEGAVFFPPSSIDAFDGNNYLGIECSTGNPEYVQAFLSEPMQAGVSYCVSFYASVNDNSDQIAPSLGVMFTDELLNDSPFELGLNADVQGGIEWDPTVWTLITGMYTAVGNEDVIVVGGFENVGTMPYPYMYVDQISVVAMPPLNLEDGEVCDGQTLVLDASAPGAQYAWSTGASSPSLLVHQPGTYEVVRTLGTCTQTDSAVILACDIEEPNPEDTIPEDTVIVVPVDSISIETLQPYYIPNAFTPDGDGVNDYFFVSGPDVENYEFTIYNRWGEKIFVADDVQDRWTGNAHGGGHFVPDGIYVYALRAAISISEVIEQRGHVLVIR